MGLGREGSIGGKSTKFHRKSILGKPFCAIPKTFTSYCPPGFRPKTDETIINNKI